MGRHLVGWLLIAVLGGCAVPAKPPLEPLPAVSAQELLHSLELRAGRFEALQGLGRIRVTVTGRSQSARQVLLVARPDRLRTEVLGPLGQTVLTVAAGEGMLTAFLPGEKRFLSGAATPDNLQRLIRVPLAPAELVRLMLHDVPLADASAARAELREDRYVLLLPTAGGGLQTLFLDGRKRLRTAQFERNGVLQWRVGYDDFRPEDDLPLSMRLEWPSAETDVELQLSDVKINTTLPAERFRLTPPAGVMVEALP